MFVVVSLGPPAIVYREASGVRAFVTPTVVFFASVLVVAAVMTMPSLSAPVLGAVLALAGAGALIYMTVIGAHRQWRRSKLDRLDWLWYVGLPMLSYVLTVAAAGAIGVRAPLGVVVLGGAMILLLVIGIRNAWDLVLWMAQQHRP